MNTTKNELDSRRQMAELNDDDLIALMESGSLIHSSLACLLACLLA